MEKQKIEVFPAKVKDIEQVLTLLQKYHVNDISDNDRKDGFVTTNINHEQLIQLIETENGLIVAKQAGRVTGFVIAASWQFLKIWPMFDYMMGELPKYAPYGEPLNTDNSYQYGPICIDKNYRGGTLAKALFNCSAQIMSQRYDYLVTFINKINGRSYAVHARKLSLDDTGSFSFNNNHYHLMTFDMRNIKKILSDGIALAFRK